MASIVNDNFSSKEVVEVGSNFGAVLSNAADPEKYPTNAEDLVGLPDETTPAGIAAKVAEEEKKSNEVSTPQH